MLSYPGSFTAGTKPTTKTQFCSLLLKFFLKLKYFQIYLYSISIHSLFPPLCFYSISEHSQHVWGQVLVLTHQTQLSSSCWCHLHSQWSQQTYVWFWRYGHDCPFNSTALVFCFVFVFFGFFYTLFTDRTQLVIRIHLSVFLEWGRLEYRTVRTEQNWVLMHP